MKRLSKILCVGMVAAFVCCGCGKGASGRNVNNNNSVDAVLQSEIDKSTQEENTPTTTEVEALPAVVIPPTTEDVSYPNAEDNEQGLLSDGIDVDPNVDIDISVMSSDMVYATVYQLMNEPDDYVGKTIKIKGNHYSSFYEPTGLIYHYALIQDATACCAQGLEFELADGLQYPDENAEITVIGTFEIYEEDGFYYCALKNSVIQ